MSFAQKPTILFILFALSSMPLGCSGDKAEGDPVAMARRSNLGQIHEIYMQYSKANQRPPKQLSDLKQYQGIDPIALKAVENGEFVVVWGVTVGKGSGEILAYEKDAPQQGGYAVLGDGTIKKLTAQEMQAAIKR